MDYLKRRLGNHKGIAGDHDSKQATSSVYDSRPMKMGYSDGRSNIREWVYAFYRPPLFQYFEDFSPLKRYDTRNLAEVYDSPNDT
jgi:hypothetical protein